jgi:Flp pilus assembly protein TadG
MTSRIDIRKSKGQAMVEFVFVLPILMLVLFGIIQFGITFSHYVTLTDAVRAGARTAAVSRQSPTRTSDVVAKVRASSENLIPSSNITVTSTWTHGSDVVVAATVPYSIHLLGLVIASGNLSSTTTERVE